MFKKCCLKKSIMLVGCISVLLLLSGCGVTLKHVSSQNLNGIVIQKPLSIMVSDIGDEREGYGEYRDRIGQDVSYWLPVIFDARDDNGKVLPVSYYIAQSLSEDLGKIGYNTKLANDTDKRTPLTLDESIAAAKEQRMDYLVTTKVKVGKTGFWGFLFIPFVEPVWTNITYDSQLIDMQAEKDIVPLQTNHRKTEWYFAKVTIFDAIFDAGLFGKYWHSTAWGKTVVSDALAETAQKISEKVQSK
jgi:hypothetical protein